MKRLYVKPEFRRLKISRRLSESIINRAQQIGYHVMRIHTISAFKEANRLYASLGFVEMASYEDTPREDAVYLELKLR